MGWLLYKQKLVETENRMGKIIENYSLQNELGSGTYSRVYKAINLKTKQEVAIKMVRADKFRELPKLQEGTINEINILSNLEPCPYIIRYFDMLKTVNNFYFVYEFCNGGTLERILKKNGALSEPSALGYFRQITQAFKVLTKHNIMHRDIKPENILLNDGIVKIADFGFCKVLENPDDMAQTMLGSPIYMAPEILKGDPYTIKADIWSLGVILFRMIFGYCPFESTNIAKLIMILDSEELHIPTEPKASPILLQLIKRMLTKDPANRTDWLQVFSYEISENGIMQPPKIQKDSGHFKPLGDSNLGTNASSSVALHHQPLGNDYNRNYQSSSRILKGRSDATLESRSFDRDINAPIVNENRNFLTQQANSQARSKSPYREKSNKMETYMKTHTKCIQINILALQVAAYSSCSAICVSYVLTRGVEHELQNIADSARKEMADSRDYEENRYKNIVGIVSEEMFQLRNIMEAYREELMSFKNANLSGLEEQKRINLREFISNLQLESREELVMAARLTDYIDESLLIRKETYQKLSKEQLHRQIHNNSKSHD